MFGRFFTFTFIFKSRIDTPFTFILYVYFYSPVNYLTFMIEDRDQRVFHILFEGCKKHFLLLFICWLFDKTIFGHRTVRGKLVPLVNNVYTYFPYSYTSTHKQMHSPLGDFNSDCFLAFEVLNTFQ